MVQKFNYSVQDIHPAVYDQQRHQFFLTPLIGKGILRFGERKMLSLEYASLIFIFLSYAVTESRWMVAGLYILDHIFSIFPWRSVPFFQKTGGPRDIAPTMAVGFTINHIAAVFLPAIGGFAVDGGITASPFSAGAVLALVSLLPCRRFEPDGAVL